MKERGTDTSYVSSSQKDEQLFDDLSHLEKLALELGATRVIRIDVSDVVVDDRVRLKCLVPRCSQYGTLMCPPNLPSLDEFRKVLSRYSWGILVSLEYRNPPHPNSIHEYDEVRDGIAPLVRALSNMMLKLEGEALKRGYRFAAGFSGGECMLCNECVGPGETCRHPFLARPSMEAMGIDVVETLRNVGVEIVFPVTDRLELWSLLLLD